jgi:hypothetical protein
MTFSGGGWTLSRTSAHLSPLEFSQRFTGALGADGALLWADGLRGHAGADGDTITGRWEISRDGSHWVHDFDLIHTRLSVEPGS